MGLGSVKPVSSTPPHAQTFEAIYPGTSQVVAIGAASVQSSAFQNVVTAGSQQVTSCIQICATVACFVAVGANPTAVANTTMYVPLGTPIRLAVNPGDKIAVIQAASSGRLYVTEGA